MLVDSRLLTGSSKIAVLALVLVNLVPLFGVYFFSWSQASVLFAYWAESLAIGFYAIFKMFSANGENANMIIRIGNQTAKLVRPSDVQQKLGILLLAILFISVYGFVLLVGLIGVFHAAITEYVASPVKLTPEVLLAIVTDSALILGLFFLSHGLSFYFNFLKGAERKTANPAALFLSPFVRILPMWLATFFAFLGGAPVVVLILVKTSFDLLGYMLSHGMFGEPQSVPMERD